MDDNDDGIAERVKHAEANTSVTKKHHISMKSCSSPASNERARRTPNPHPNCESKTEKLGEIAYDRRKSTERERKRRSKSSTSESGIKGRKTNRPCTKSAEEGKTECQLNSKDDMVENTMTYESPKEFEKDTLMDDVSSPILKLLYDKLWKSRNKLVKSLIIIWLCVSTFTAVRIMVEMTNAYFGTSFDDCYSANNLCRRYGIACFSRCGMSRWNVYWRQSD